MTTDGTGYGCKNPGTCLTNTPTASGMCNKVNCDTLWNLMIKSSDGSNSDGNVGMTAVNQILKDEPNAEYLKNQIRHLLCQLGQQNVYQYSSYPLNVSSSLLTWDGIRTLNGWGNKGSGYHTFYCISITVVAILYWKIMLLKIFKQSQKNSSPSIFKLLIIGSTGGVLNMFKGLQKKVVYFFITFTSGVLYWFVSQFFTTVAAGADIIRDAKEAKPGEIPIIATTPRGFKALPIIIGVIFPICIMGCRYAIENNENSRSFTAIRLLFQGLVIGLYTYFLIYLAKNSVDSQVSVSFSSESEVGLKWNTNNKDNSTFTNTGTINTNDRPNPVYATVKAFLTCIIVLLILFLASFWFESGNNGKVNSGTLKCEINNTLDQLNNYNNEMTKIIPITFFSMLLMIVYFVLSGANLFFGICYPQVYIVLLIFQRLLITNIAYFDESDWHRNWDFLFFPLLSKTVNTLLVKQECRESQEYISELYGTTNYKVFGRTNSGPAIPGTRGIIRGSWFSYPPRKLNNKNISGLVTEIAKEIPTKNNVKRLFNGQNTEKKNKIQKKLDNIISTVGDMNNINVNNNNQTAGGRNIKYTKRSIKIFLNLFEILLKPKNGASNKDITKNIESITKKAKIIYDRAPKNSDLKKIMKRILDTNFK